MDIYGPFPLARLRFSRVKRTLWQSNEIMIMRRPFFEPRSGNALQSSRKKNMENNVAQFSGDEEKPIFCHGP